ALVVSDFALGGAAFEVGGVARIVRRETAHTARREQLRTHPLDDRLSLPVFEQLGIDREGNERVGANAGVRPGALSFARLAQAVVGVLGLRAPEALAERGARARRALRRTLGEPRVPVR